MTLGEKIKKARKVFNLSQEELAEKLNVSRQAITKWETDSGMPEISNLKMISDLFGVSVDYLLDDEKEMEYPLLKEQIIMDKKNNYINRFDYVVDYLRKNYSDIGDIYVLTETGKKTSKIDEIVDFFTWGISCIPYYIELIINPVMWFVVETEYVNYIVKATKKIIEIKELPSSVNTNKFIFDKTKLEKNKNKL